MFKKGDKVRRIKDCIINSNVVKGGIYTVKEVLIDTPFMTLEEITNGDEFACLGGHFELVKQDNNMEKIAPKSFSITGKPHHLVAMEEDLKEMGYSNWSNVRTDYNFEDTGICLNRYGWNEEVEELTRHSDKNKNVHFQLPSQYSEAITFCKQQLEIAKEYFKKEDEIKVGDYVICIEHNDYAGSGWELNKVFKVGSITTPDTCRTVYFPTDGRGVYSQFVRKATKEEIENSKKVTILGYDCQVHNYIVSFGCVEVRKALIKDLYKAFIENDNFIRGLHAITAEQLEKLNDLISE